MTLDFFVWFDMEVSPPLVNFDSLFRRLPISTTKTNYIALERSLFRFRPSNFFWTSSSTERGPPETITRNPQTTRSSSKMRNISLWRKGRRAKLTAGFSLMVLWRIPRKFFTFSIDLLLLQCCQPMRQTHIRGWTPPKQPKMKVKFRGCQHTGCWICSTVISKPPSKLYFGFKIVMIFARQPPDSLLTASWQPLDSHSKTFVGLYFWEFLC